LPLCLTWRGRLTPKKLPDKRHALSHSTPPNGYRTVCCHLGVRFGIGWSAGHVRAMPLAPPTTDALAYAAMELNGLRISPCAPCSDRTLSQLDEGVIARAHCRDTDK